MRGRKYLAAHGRILGRFAIKGNQFGGAGEENTPFGSQSGLPGLPDETSSGFFADRTPEMAGTGKAAKSLAAVIPDKRSAGPESRVVPLKIQANPFFAALDSGFRFAAPE